MTTARRTTAIAATTLAILALACASAPPPPAVGPSQIEAAEQSGTLEALYDDTASQLSAPTLTPEQRAQLQQVQREAGAKLAARRVEDVQRELSEVPRVVAGLAPLTALEALKARIEPIRRWSQSQYSAISDQLSAETQKTNAAIAERKAELDAAAPDNVAGRLGLLDDLTALSGIGSTAASGYAEARAEIVAGLSREATTAIEEENYGDAKRILEIVKEVDPSNESTTERLAAVDTKMFEKEFYQALEVGDPDRGYALLSEISTSEHFDLIRPQLAPSADAMAGYYVSLGAAATKKKDVQEAHRRFQEARDIREILGGPNAGPPAEEAAFVKLLNQQFESARKRDQLGLAWGYLNVIESMEGDSPALRRNMRETREQVLQRAIKRVSVSAFEDPQGATADFGDAVASGVVQHLFEAIPNDIRMIEREQLSDIMREKDIGGAKDALAAADFLVQGTILEAEVDTLEKTGKKTMRVTTEEVQQTNPDYNTWLNLKSKEREKVPQPPQTISVPRKEDVSVEVTVHRKVGIFSVSFRVIDAATAKVVFADSVREKAEHEDTSSEGVELGDFKMEFKLASLPSDIEILAGLADMVSTAIGTQLADVLKDPEKSYRESAERFEREANYEAAAQQYAYAIVLEERKGQDVTDLLAGLRAASIASSLH